MAMHKGGWTEINQNVKHKAMISTVHISLLVRFAQLQLQKALASISKHL